MIVGLQAVALVGGQGMRLRPLTLTTPKPLLPLANRPIVEHVIRWLADHGVTETILATQYRASDFARWLRRWQGMPVRAVEEPIALGTAGAVANVASGLHSTTAVINGDNITNLDLTAMLQAHRATSADVTIAIDQVDDPTGRGVVLTNVDGRVQRFQEKPAPGTALARTVNTGTYLIEPHILDTIPQGRSAMWETDIFPALIDAGARVYAFQAPHIWLDTGTPAGYWAAQAAILSGALGSPAGTEHNGLWTEANVSFDSGAMYEPPICIGFGSIIAAGAHLVGPLSVGRECHILTGAQVRRAAVWDGSMIEPGAIVDTSIIGYNCYVAADACVVGALIGDNVVIRPGVRIEHGATIGPGSIVEAAYGKPPRHVANERP